MQVLKLKRLTKFFNILRYNVASKYFLLQWSTLLQGSITQHMVELQWRVRFMV